MTTHEGAPMSTHPEVVTLDPNDAEDRTRVAEALHQVALEQARTYDLMPNDEAAATLLLRFLVTPPAPPIPEEPAWWTIVRLNHKLWAIRDAITSANGGGNWLDNTGARHTWPEVCALGTPEVLEPESVKALREQVNRYDAWLERVADALAEARGVRVHWSDLDTSVKALVDRAEKAEREVEEFIAIDEEPAPVEVTRPAFVPVTEEPKPGTHLFDAAGIEWRRAMGCERWHQVATAGFCLVWDNLLKHHGPLTLVETGGQS